MNYAQTDVEKLSALTSKLLYETERLRRDVIKLHGRIEPFKGEPPFPEPAPLMPRKNWRIQDVFEMIEGARHNIRDCELDLGAIRSSIDSIEKDTVSREEMKPYLRRT